MGSNHKDFIMHVGQTVYDMITKPLKPMNNKKSKPKSLIAKKRLQVSDRLTAKINASINGPDKAKYPKAIANAHKALMEAEARLASEILTEYLGREPVEDDLFLSQRYLKTDYVETQEWHFIYDKVYLGTAKLDPINCKAYFTPASEPLEVNGEAIKTK